MRFLFLLLINFVLVSALSAQDLLPPIGQWREHLPYNSAIDVTAGGGKIYCATPFSLFTVTLTENSIDRLSKVTGLSETGISAIKYDLTNDKLIIVYTNSNVDVIYRNDILNIPDIKRKNVSGDKSVYNIYPLVKNYYLSTGLGVIVIDGEKYEVKETWIIGNAGNTVKVTGFTTDNTFFYASTDEGLKRAAVNVSNLADYQNWQLLSGANGLPAGICKDVVNLQNKIIALANDSLFILNAGKWNLFYADGWPIVSINSTGNKIELCQRMNNGTSKVTILNPDGSIARALIQPGVISFPRKVILHQDNYWIADQYGGLSEFNSISFENYKLNSPEGTASGELVVKNGIFYAAAGEVNESWNYLYNGNGVYKFSEGQWTNYNRFKFPRLDSLLDFITVAIDPRDESIWSGSFGGGLLHIKTDQTFEIFKQNSPLSPAIGDPTSYRVAGLTFDNDNNLWISNFASARPLLVRKNDGTWTTFTIPYTLTENAVAQIVVDDFNQKWIVSPLGNGLVVFNHGKTIDDLSDDRWKLYHSGIGNGNLPANDVLCVAKDKSGFIWVGTSDGIAVIQCPQEAFTSHGCEAILPVVQQGNFAGYLFKGEEVRSIALDGADRKWIATKNGVWLISADGGKVIYQFTENNSPLLSSDVFKIAIDAKTGEIYFATLKGICSFRSSATEGGTQNENVLVFPNPVPPGYSGTIAIRGLVNNAVVKITELDGRLVYQARALGGQAIWDGRDYKGRKISSGVYLVLVNDDGRQEKKATKIVYIGK